MDAPAPNPLPSPGWYADESADEPGTRRWWNGHEWTEHVAYPGEQVNAPGTVQREGAVTVWKIAGGILIAVIVIWLVLWLHNQSSQVDCVINEQPGQISTC